MPKNETKPNLALATQAKKGQEILSEKAQSFHDGNEALQRALQSGEFVGAANAVQRIAESLNAQAIQAWETFQKDEMYKGYGCSTFVEFLERHPKLGLTKTRFYERKQLLANEGAETFDLLNTLQVPFKIRKQLTAGSVQIEGNQLTINDRTFPLDDVKKVKQAIADLAEQMERIENRSAKTEKELEKTKQKLADAKEDARTAALNVPDDGTDPVNQAYLHVLASLTELGRELAELPGKEADQRMAQFKPDIQHAIELLFTFSASNAPTRRPTAESDALGFSQSELAELMED